MEYREVNKLESISERSEINEDTDIEQEFDIIKGNIKLFFGLLTP